MGLTPDGIIGHSLGEVACGYADGCLSQEEAVLSAYWRGQCIKEANILPGAMVAVGRCHLVCPTPHPRSAHGSVRVSLRGGTFPSTSGVHTGQRGAWGQLAGRWPPCA